MVDVDLRPGKKRKTPRPGKRRKEQEPHPKGERRRPSGGLGKVLLWLLVLGALAFLGYQYWNLRTENEQLKLRIATMGKPKVIERTQPFRVEDLSLRGIVTGGQGTILLLQDPQGRDYLLRLGDVLAGYVLETLSGDSLVLRSDTSRVVLKLEAGS